MPAPIALFIFNRPEHLRHTLASLARCEGFAAGQVVVFGDGPKRDEQVPLVEAARSVARSMLGDRAAYCFRDDNAGLARSIIDGARILTEEHGNVIVVEDDLVLAPGFLAFMNAALRRYADEPLVYQVSGHAFDAPELAGSTRAAFLPFTTTWGWATWRRAWRQFDEAASGWEKLRTDASLRRRFNLDGAYDYAAMIERQMSGKVDSWGIRWYWSVFKHNGLTLFPPRTLLSNEGFDGSGSHGRGLFRRHEALRHNSDTDQFDLPEPTADEQAFAAVRREILRRNGGRVGKIVDMLKKIAGR